MTGILTLTSVFFFAAIVNAVISSSDSSDKAAEIMAFSSSDNAFDF